MGYAKFTFAYWCLLIAALLPLGCAWLAKSGTFGKPRKEGYALFRAAYTARSSVVHGYGRKLKASRLESLSNELRYMLARFLSWLVDDSPRLGFSPRMESDDWLTLLFESPR